MVHRRSFLTALGSGASSALWGCRPDVGSSAASVVPEVRGVTQVVAATPTMDGAGVRLSRALGAASLPALDPFLMLDQIRGDTPSDYLQGFPPHPHRGFETVTYMIEGAMEHRDSVGNHGRLVGGGLQWMTAGRGLVHSEMPQQERGLLFGFQLWVNLPRRLKMVPPRYQDLSPDLVPEVPIAGHRVRVLAGTAGGAQGPVDGVSIAPVMLDATLSKGSPFVLELPRTHNTFVYLLSGVVASGGDVFAGQKLAVFGPGASVRLEAREPSRLLLLSGEPIGEPIARRGPFVMNTEEELDQAFEDYRTGRLG